MSLLPLATFSAPGVPLYGAGGGGGGGSSFSTLSASTITVSTLAAYDITMKGGGIEMSNNTISLGIVGTAANPLFYYNAGDSNVYLTGLSTHSVYIGTASTPTEFAVVDGGVNILGNLNVSSFNNQAPTFKATYLVSTLTGCNAYIPPGNVAWPLSGDIGTSAGHTYRISGNLAWGNTGGSGNTTLAITGGGAGFPNFIATVKNADAIPGNNGLAGGVSAVFKPASGTSIQINGYNTDPAQSTLLEFYNTYWVVEDLGNI